MRKFVSALAILWALACPALAAGSIQLALSQQIGSNGSPLGNCQLYLYQSGTISTPQNAYQDFGLTTPYPWPVPCDANGRLPMFFLADGTTHVRLTDSSGIVQIDAANVPVLGQSNGGGGGTPVDPTTIASTGDIKFRPTGEFLSGWVKLNGQTIGSAASGASGRANADTQNLYVYLWTNCTNAHCPVSGGRGATAVADFNANKQLTLPDWRARIPVGLDDMGNTPAGILQAKNVTSAGDGVTTPGATGGEAVHTLSIAEAPVESFTVNDTRAWQVPVSLPSTGIDSTVNAGTGSSGITLRNQPVSITSGSISVSSNAGGGNHNVMNPFMLGTWYQKL